MKYKAGDKVKIKTWKEIKNISKNKKVYIVFTHYMKNYFERQFPDRIVEIERVYGSFYKTKELEYAWTDDMIEEKVIFEPIYSRFEILDIR